MSITPNNLDYTINEVFYEILIKTFEQWKVDINLLNKAQLAYYKMKMNT